MGFGLNQVLLITDDEDDFVNLRAIFNEISGVQYNLVWKNSYAAGLEALKASAFDVCLLDFRLGEKSGLDLLRDAKHAGVATPVILLTGQGDFDLDIRAMQTGASDYLVKTQINAPLLERAVRYSMKRALDTHDLAEERENFKILFNSTFEGIVVHRAGTITAANAAIGQILGVGATDLVGTSLFSWISPAHQAALATQITMQEGQQAEVIGIKKDGSEVHLGISSKTIVLKGRPVGLMAVRDLTRQKQMEAQILQQDRLASLGLLASSLAHEIGTPLGVIRGRAEMAAKTNDEKLKSTMELIITQIDRVSKLVNSLLHLARGKQSEFATDVDLSSVVSDVVNLMSYELSRKGIALEVSIPSGLRVRAEVGPLGQVFLNLFVNAVHAIEEVQKQGDKRSHRVSVTAYATDDKTEVKVCDSGSGISAANMRQMFKPFFTTKEIGVGTGLGLATSYKLMQSWGGSISAESKEGEGTCFALKLLRGSEF